MNNLFIPMYKILVRVLLIIVVASGFLFNSLDLQGTKVEASTSGATTLSIEPVTKNVSAGDTFTLNVLVAPATAIAGAQFNLSYDPAVLQINSVTEGGLLKQNGNTSFFLPGDIDNTEGLLKNVAGAITTSGGEVSEEGVLATVTFTAKASGTSTLTLSNVIAGSKVGQSVPVQVIGGSVTVQGGTSSESVSGVSLDQTSCSLTVGETGQLTATVQPANASNKNVTWTSDNEAVATVDATGKVTAVSAGTANITVTTADGGFTATCAVTVQGGTSSESVSGVSLDKTSCSLTVGETGQLTATVQPANASNKDVIWSSDNEAVATVDATGKVTAVSAGTANITVTTADGGFTATCAVTITTGSATIVGIDPATKTVSAGDTFDLDVLITPATAIAGAQFNLSYDPAVLQVNSVTEGGLLKQNGNTSFFLTGVIDNNSGLLNNVAGAITTSGGEVSGAGSLAVISFTAKATGTSTLTLSNVIAANKAAQAVPVQVNGGSVTVQGGTSSESVSGVSLDKTSYSLTVGETGQLTATVAPANASNKNVTWTSDNEAVATVDATGKVTAVSAGTADITVTTADGGFTATCAVTIATGSVTIVGIDPATKTVSAGDTFNLDVLITPATAIAGAQFNLSYDPAVLQVNSVTEGGLLKQNGNTSFFLTGVIDNNSGLLNNVAGAITTPGGEVSGEGSLAVISFTAKATGTSTLALSNVIAANKAAQAVPVQVNGGSVTVQGGTSSEPVSGVSLDQTSYSLTVGETGQLTATVAPANASNKNVTWTSDNEAVATVDATGKVTAVSAGTANITVTTADGGLTATCAVTVQGGTSSESVSGVSLDQTSCSLTVGETGQLTATVAPANASNKNVTWTSDNEAVATVDATGKVTAVSAGTANITVTTADGGFTATCAVTIAIGSVTIVGIDPATKTVSAGDTFDLDVLITPATAIAGAQFNLSYDPAVLQVNSVTEGGLLKQNGNTSFFLTGVIDNNSGLLNNVAGAITTPGGEVSGEGSLAVISFTAKATGTSTLALSNVIAANKAAQAVPVQVNGGSVTVQGGTSSEPVSGVSLDQTSYSLAVGETGQLTATVAPANASNKNVTWTSDNEAVATVDATGKVTAVSAGTANITVTTADGGLTATCAVTVQGGTSSESVSGVSLDQASCSLTVGETGQLTATVAPANASNKNVTWTSDNEAVATVDATGKVTAVSAGTANITVTTADGGFTATCAVTVQEGTSSKPVTGVSLDKTSDSLTVGGTAQLTAAVQPADASNKDVTWSSDNEAVATVDATGKVTAVSVGTANITVTTADGGFTDTCVITVPQVVNLDPDSNSIAVTNNPMEVNVPKDVANPQITLTPSSGGSFTMPQVKVKADTSLGTVSVGISAGTQITGPADWNGIIALPQVLLNNAVTVTPTSGKTATVEAVVEIGASNDVALTFDHAVRMLIPGMAGKQAGYVRGGVFQKIETLCEQDSQEWADSNLPAEGAGKIDVNGDLVIWTKHFTKFVTYTETAVGGGGGGGGGGSSTTTPSVQTSEAAGITESSATLNGSITSSGGSAVTSYGFVWGTDQNNLDKKVQVGTDNHSGSFQTNLSGLTAGITYYFKAYAVNSKGTKQGAIKQFTAAAAAQQPSVEVTSPNGTPSNVKSFSDVANSHWAYNAISQLSKNGLVNGYPDGTFRPDREMSRAEFVTVLSKALQLPDYKPAASTFGDVAASDWYAGAVETVVHAGIISGYGNGSFGPNDSVTREQASVILVKALGKNNEAAAKMLDSTGFTDDTAISSWARGFVVAAEEQNLLKGYPDSTFRPQQNMTRAEICTVIKNLLDTKSQSEN
ncbi:Ig domain protein group 2 domain protein [Desulfofarcimen acetoxidans DSM 771]|uniref:Ig domain protein group 2 domain protein n=1 Tax=Desulfofarcimen acetoxidans (strain ATCC 49208 / DSM 771 / KCTC 5769 / VKM B-1644 / 5575) TaxID=485916 RepID=C8VYB6_DESAS|nr:Ig-like domain-containing protein [Desulfofarcimen acetoxidans]ACV62797.1 Ig domain protein group 2 domain protein [Desulfofarcimen acetoxidans DSM 771]